jgi:hypothetical protein
VAKRRPRCGACVLCSEIRLIPYPEGGEWPKPHKTAGVAEHIFSEEAMKPQLPPLKCSPTGPDEILAGKRLRPRWNIKARLARRPRKSPGVVERYLHHQEEGHAIASPGRPLKDRVASGRRTPRSYTDSAFKGAFAFAVGWLQAGCGHKDFQRAARFLECLNALLPADAETDRLSRRSRCSVDGLGVLRGGGHLGAQSIVFVLWGWVSR